MKSLSKSVSYGLVLFSIGALFTIPLDSELFGIEKAYATGLDLTMGERTVINLNDPEVDRAICVFAEFTDFELSDGGYELRVINQDTGEVIYETTVTVGSTKVGLDDFDSVVAYIATERMIDDNEVFGGNYVIEISTSDGSVSQNLPFTILPYPSGGGSSYAAPSITQASFTSLGNPDEGFGGIIQDVDLNSLSTTQIIKTGDDALIRIGINDADGISDIEHVTIYLNYRGQSGIIPFKTIDTFITYQKGQPLSINDPNGLLNSADLNIVQVDAGNAALNLEINFAKEMDTSNIAFRSWDLARNVVSTEFVNAIQVINPNENTIDGVSNQSISNWLTTSFDWWSQGLISDAEFFNTVEFLSINGLIQSDFNTVISNLIATS